MIRGARRSAAVVTAMLILVLAGCAQAQPGPPDPFPPRPEAIDLSRLDPCATLTPQQLAPLGLGPEDRRTGTPVVGGKSTRVCGWSNGEVAFGYSVQFIPADAVDAVGAEGATVEVIEGYGAVRTTDRETTAPLCEIHVDSSEGQLIRTQTRALKVGRDGSLPTIDETCRRAVNVTAEMIRTARAARW